MIVFALDSSGSTAAVAITRDGETLVNLLADTGLTHSQTLLPLCVKAFEMSGIKLSETDCIGITSGPGSFTGLRIGMSTIKGFCTAHDIPCAPVSTTYALALSLGGESGTVVPVMDARADRVYFAAFDMTRDKRLLPDAAERIDDLPELLKNCPAPLIFVGNAAGLCYNRLKEKTDCRAADESFCAVSALNVAHAAARMFERNETVSGARIAPDYLQLPQAMRNLNKETT